MPRVLDGSQVPAGRILCGDALSVLAAEPAELFDTIYIDPPFSTGATQRGKAGSYSDGMKLEHFVPWLLERLVQCHRVLKPTGSLFVHLDFRAVHHVRVELDRLFGPDRLVNEIIWAYSIGGKSDRSFGRKHDTILWYSKSDDYLFFPERVRVPRKPNSHMRTVRDPDGRLVQEKTDRKTGRVYRYALDDGKLPEDVWTDIETLNRSDRQRTGWPTQKPERLIERLLLATTPEAGRVADVFAGSGTTGRVAVKLGFDYLLCDILPEAVALARANLAQSSSAKSSQPSEIT